MTSDPLIRTVTIRVLVVHADSMATELLVGALKRHSRFDVSTCIANVEAVPDKIRSWKPDVVLLHPHLQDGLLSGFNVLRQLRTTGPEVRCVMLLERPERQMVVDAFRDGAKGVFCPSQSDFKMLCKCIDRVFAGQVWARNNELEYVLDALAQNAPLRAANPEGMQLLSKREQQVVNLLAEGLTNREIARQLCLSEHTVKNYLFKIFDKVDVSSRVELVLYAVNCGRRTDWPPNEPQVQELVEEALHPVSAA